MSDIKIIPFEVCLYGGNKTTVQIPVKYNEELGSYLMTEESHEIIDDTKIKNLGADFVVTDKFLKIYKEKVCFVFGSSFMGRGYGGAASLRDNSNTFPFITKIRPNNEVSSFYRPENYYQVYDEEIKNLKHYIETSEYKTYLISKLGDGLANRFNIWEEVISPNIKKDLEKYVDKIVFLF